MVPHYTKVILDQGGIQGEAFYCCSPLCELQYKSVHEVPTSPRWMEEWQRQIASKAAEAEQTLPREPREGFVRPPLAGGDAGYDELVEKPQ